jgi:RNA polymerase sigma-70 factor (ECF subfamily)
VGRLDVHDHSRPRSPAGERLPDADARLLEQIRSGDIEAGQRFVREQYSAIYRYLFYLVGRRDLAEDLTQETFLEGWRCLETFQGRGSLRGWLLRIAHRQFLHRLQRRPAELGLEAMADVAAPGATAWMDALELRDLIDRLPLEQREVVLLHYLEGYTSTQIARIVDAPVGTICYRLARAREKLRQALGEDDLTYLNEPLAPMRQWAWLPPDQMHALEARLSLDDRAKENEMERREFLRQAAMGAAGLVLSEPEKEVVDGRLTQKVTLAFKGTALSDLCQQISKETGVHLTAGSSVADEKVTLFCEKAPLREVMRQLSRPFGYAWTRSGKAGAYRYELSQDLRSQLLEEELRNRDRNAALLSLDRDIERYRPYLGLSPDEAFERAKTAPPAQKKLLEQLSRYGWGPLQMYFRLSRDELRALRAGEHLTFSQEPKPGERPLPPEVANGVLQGLRNWRLKRMGDGYSVYGGDEGAKQMPDGLPPAAVPEVRAKVDLEIKQSELGQFVLDTSIAAFLPPTVENWFHSGGSDGPVATGQNPNALKPQSAAPSARTANDLALRATVTLAPIPSCPPMALVGNREPGAGSGAADAKVTSADVLEALHHATGMPIIADFYTRLFPVADVSVQNRPLSEALDHLAQAMCLRWEKDREAGWLQFRSATFYDDRVKEVPNRLLSRWSEGRRKQGMLSLNDLIEIAQLADAQLDAKEMAEGAKTCWGLAEWELARHDWTRPHLRFLATFTPEQRALAMGSAGLPFARMTLAQQQEFLRHALVTEEGALRSLEELEGAALRVDYIQPGGYEWVIGGGNWPHFVTAVVPGKQGRRVVRAPVRGRSRNEVLLAARRVDPAVEETSIQPTKLHLLFLYMPGTSNKRCIRVVGDNVDVIWGTW